MTGHWVLKFDDGREGWANLVSDDYPQDGVLVEGQSRGSGLQAGRHHLRRHSGVLQGRPGDPVQRPGNAETIPLRSLRHRGQSVHDGLRGDIRQQTIQIQGPPPLGNRGPITEKIKSPHECGDFIASWPIGYPDSFYARVMPAQAVRKAHGPEPVERAGIHPSFSARKVLTCNSCRWPFPGRWQRGGSPCPRRARCC